MLDYYNLGVKVVIMTDDHKVLLLRKDPKNSHNIDKGVYWDVPGGRLERGEDVFSTLQRETKAETGLDIEDPKHLVTVLTKIRNKTDLLDDVGLFLAFYTAHVSHLTEIQLAPEHSEYAWVDIVTACERLAPIFPEEFIQKLQTL